MNRLIKYSIHLATGLAFAFLNIAVNYLVTKFSFPLFMDTIFTVAASFFSCASGIICATVYHVLVVFLLDYKLSDIAFIICSLTIVLVVCIAKHKPPKIKAVHLMLMATILAVVLSFEGSALYTFIYNRYQYAESVRTQWLSFMFLKSELPLMLSAFLARGPVNLIDKIIAMFAGWYIYRLIQKPAEKINSKE